MTLLQVLPSNLTDFSLEKILIAAVIILQLIWSLKLYIKIRKISSTFEEPLKVIEERIKKSIVINQLEIESDEDETIKLSLVKSSGTNNVMIQIVKSLNSYLINNYGAVVNFSIIKDIIDREIDVEDEDISQSISTPLYLGLAATIIGIIFGLWAMPELKGDNFLDGIDVLINGVKIAMVASFCGLICTTTLSSGFYKKAKRIILRDKNEQLSYLQAKLLPELLRAEDTGVSGLKASLDRFAREATKITENVRIAANQTERTVQMQLDVIDKVKDLNMTKVSKVNLELFDRLDTNMAAFQQFSHYLSSMNKISENLVAFSNKTENIEAISQEIKSTLKDSKDLSKFLTAHFQEIQNAGGFALQAVNLTHSHFKEAIEKLDKEIQERINYHNNLSDSVEIKLKETFEKIGEKLNKITEEHLNSLSVAYKESVPNFNQLDNLNLLPELRVNSATQSKELIAAIKSLNDSVKSLGSKINNESLLIKLDEIENNLKKRTTFPLKPEEKRRKVGFFRKIRNRFTKKSEMRA